MSIITQPQPQYIPLSFYINKCRNIHEACIHNNLVNVNDFIILDEKNKNLKNSIGETPLFIACKNNFYRIAELLLTYKCNINDSTFFEYTPLHIASINNHYDIVKLLLNNNALINLKNKYNGNTALHEACINNSLDIILYLIEKNIDIEIKNKENKIAFELIDNDIIFEKIINKMNLYILTKEKDISYITCLLPTLYSKNKLDFVLKVLDIMNNINYQNENNETFLHIILKNLYYSSKNISLYNEQVDFLKKIIQKYNPSMNIKDNKGDTVLHKACKYDLINVIDFLIKNENINQENNKGNTALHICCKNNKFDLAVILLENKNINIYSKNKKKIQPFFYACENKNSQMIQLFFNKKIKITESEIEIIKKNINNLDICYILDKYHDEKMTYLEFIRKNPYYIKHLRILTNIDNIKTITLSFEF
jgi:ankyrin repeat protein